ncbi:E3 ubiquitin/ISG15 ligase TRIM25 [Stigmatopora argus]
MADVDTPEMSLLSLSDDLTCSICLSTFDCPVTTPCGHNFCQQCLLDTWKESYSCPQCRTQFYVKPELKKNTVLTAVTEAFKTRSASVENTSKCPTGKGAPGPVVRCDTCMKAKAVKTCLTCMASYCAEHLRPHRENPVFGVHQLTECVDNLLERICPDHHKLMEIFCTKHDCLICTLCLPEMHKTCDFIPPEQQRAKQESNLRQKLDFVDQKIQKNQTVVSQMQEIQLGLKGIATSKKKAIAHEYQQIQAMLAAEERAAMSEVDQELASSNTKLRVLMKKFLENISSLSTSKADIQNLLCQSQTMSFLQVSICLPKAATFDPHTPRISLSSKILTASEEFAVDLKHQMRYILAQPVIARQPMFKTEENILKSYPINNIPLAAKADKFKSDRKTPQKKFNKAKAHMEPSKIGMQKLSCSMENLFSDLKPRLRPQPFKTPQHTEKTEKLYEAKEHQVPCKIGMQKLPPFLKNNLLNEVEQRHGSQPYETPSELTEKPEKGSLTNVIGEKRSDLLKYGTAISFDPMTAHKRIALSEGFTKASVSEQPNAPSYIDCPERFSVCSQVLASQGFSSGCHYWEVTIQNHNYTGIGLAYGSIDRKGPTSRLGRNAKSWCVEWFNVSLSSWHNSNQVVLATQKNSKRIGVFINCTSGLVTFYNVADRAYPFYSFVFPFTEAVYPAFWIFDSESSISLCKLESRRTHSPDNIS